MAFRRTSYGLSEPSVSMRNSWVSLINGASCGSFAARVSMARRRSNGGRRNSFVTAWLRNGKRFRRLTVLLDAGAQKNAQFKLQSGPQPPFDFVKRRALQRPGLGDEGVRGVC